jgi:ankyrin repeat protein
MVRVLMEAGADARKGIWPHRDATSAMAMARDRGYDDVVSAIEDAELLRRKALSCPNATISPVQGQIGAAISRGDAATAIGLLEAEPSLMEACDRNGATPLHLAAEETNVELAAWLLERRGNPRKKDVRGLTALDRAALAADPRNHTAEQFPAIARLLLDHGAEITVRAAVAMGDTTRVREKIIAEPGLLRQIGPSGGLLSLAVNHGQMEMARLLLDLGADVDERIVFEELEEPTPSWGMPLWYAALAGQLEITRLLLDRGADPNANVYASGWPLRNAWNHEDQSVRRLLLERGAKPQPYMVAEGHDVEEAQRLLAGNPKEDVVSELAWSACDNGCAAIVKLALPHLKWPADDRRWHWVLIQPIRGAGGNSAKNAGHFQSMAALLDHGINPNVQRYGQTVLHFAAAHHGNVNDEDRARFAAMLLDHGARTDLRDDLLKSTPLGWACRWGRVGMVKVFLGRGADPLEPDAELWATPRAWAKKMGHESILLELQKHPHHGKNESL